MSRRREDYERYLERCRAKRHRAERHRAEPHRAEPHQAKRPGAEQPSASSDCCATSDCPISDVEVGDVEAGDVAAGGASAARMRRRTLGIDEFEQLLRRFDSLSLRELESGLSSDEAMTLRDLARRLEFESSDFEDASDSVRQHADDDLTIDILADSDLDFEDEDDAEVAAVEPAGSSRYSRLGSLRPDAGNRRALWRQRRRGSRG